MGIAPYDMLRGDVGIAPYDMLRGNVVITTATLEGSLPPCSCSLSIFIIDSHG